MVSYTTLTFYKDTYLMGRQAVISDALFPLYALKATRTIKQYTFDNIDETETYSEAVQMCCCEMAESIFKKDNPANIVDPNVRSETTGTHSITFETQAATEDYHRSVIKGIVYNWLSDTGYLYRGLC
jgi:hypothetical protein